MGNIKKNTILKSPYNTNKTKLNSLPLAIKIGPDIYKRKERGIEELAAPLTFGIIFVRFKFTAAPYFRLERKNLFSYLIYDKERQAEHFKEILNPDSAS